VLTAEKPVVAKEAVPVERVRLDTETVTDQVQVSEEIRKEQIDVDGADDVYPAGTDRTDDRPDPHVDRLRRRAAPLSTGPTHGQQHDRTPPPPSGGGGVVVRPPPLQRSRSTGVPHGPAPA
jgi:hypothetical protein